MSTFEFPDHPSWDKRPIATQVKLAKPRGILHAKGKIVSTKTVEIDHDPTEICTLDDGSGQINLVFLGREKVAGLEVDSRCEIEGTVGKNLQGQLYILNPLYTLLSD
jgi:hypothetical protein